MWIGLLLAALAAAGSSYQQHKVNEKQQNVLLQGLQQQEDAAQQAKAKFDSSLNAYSPDKAQSVTDQNKGDYLAQVQKAVGAMPYDGANSTTTQARLLAGQRADATGQKDAQLADIYGTLTGAGQQRQKEGIATSQTGDALGLLSNKANRAFDAKRMLAGSITGNPWLQALWQVMGTTGGAMMGGAGMGAGAMASGYSPSGGGSDYLGSGFNGTTGAGNYAGSGSMSTRWPGQ